jgi:hypothetical protein
MNNAGATTITANTGLFATGDIVTIINIGTGTCTITAGTATVTTSGSLVLAQNQGGVLRFTSASAAIFLQFATPASGDIEGVTAGTGISGGGTSGTVTITNSMATAITTAGDVIYGTGSGTFARLGIGTASQVLRVNSGATAPEWATPSVAGKSYSLLNAGGTALTGAATITISGISAKDDLMIMVLGASSASASSNIYIRLNGDSDNNYRFGGPMIIGGAGYDPGSFTTELGNPTSLMRLFRISASATGTGSGTAHVVGCNTTGFKAFTVMGAGANDSSNNQRSYWYNGMYEGTSTISSVDVVSGTGDFDAGTLYIYGAA